MITEHKISSQPVVTGIITVTPATYARAALSRLAGKWWWVAVVPVAIFMLASLSDIAYMFAAMIWLFMLLPPAIMIAYYSYLLKPAAAAMARNHHVVISPDGSLLIKFEADIDDDGNTITQYPDIRLDSRQLKGIVDKGTSIQLDYSKTTVDIVIIPVNAFPQQSVALALSHLYGKDCAIYQ